VRKGDRDLRNGYDIAETGRWFPWLMPGFITPSRNCGVGRSAA